MDIEHILSLVNATTSNAAGEPSLAIDSNMAAITSWLQWCDSNGCHTQEAYADEYSDDIPCPECDGDGCDHCDAEGTVTDPDAPLTYGGDVNAAWAAVAEMVAG